MLLVVVGICRFCIVNLNSLVCFFFLLGTVYCESCILTAKDGSLTCQLCQSPHPGGFPKVCLELDNFLVEQFPKEHSYRREALQNKVRCHQESLSACKYFGCTYFNFMIFCSISSARYSSEI